MRSDGRLPGAASTLFFFRLLDPAGFGSGRLASVVSTNGTSTTYLYETYDRPWFVRENAPDGKFLQKRYNYFGHWNGLGSIRYDNHDGYITTERYIYDLEANGHLSRMEIDAGNFWQLNTMNVFEQPTSVTTGNFTRTYGYNSFGIPTSRSAGNYQIFRTPSMPPKAT